MLHVVGQSVATIVSALAKAVGLDLHLIVGNRGVLDASYSILLLLDIIEQAKVIARRLEVI